MWHWSSSCAFDARAVKVSLCINIPRLAQAPADLVNNFAYSTSPTQCIILNNACISMRISSESDLDKYDSDEYEAQSV